MKLRPHHLLCIQKFTGHGYDEAFTVHMTRLVQDLSMGRKVILHKGCDEVCSACPNNIAGRCKSFEKVQMLDEGVLEACQLSYGDNGDWSDISSIAKDLVFNTDEFYRICGSCEWYELCKNTKETSWITQTQ